MKRMILNETSYFGEGARSAIASEVSKRAFKKALVVTDKELIKLGITNLVLQVLDDNNMPYSIYDHVKPNPTIDNVQKGVDAYKESKADYIIGVGGGSPIDTAKAIGIIANNPEHYDVKSLAGEVATKNKSVPIIALPTTAGTATEVTINYVITDEDSHNKMPCIDPNDIPIIAIVDTDLMMSMPKGLTASTGMDALTHAIEGYITAGAWDMTDMYTIKAIELIAKNLEQATFKPDDVAARNGMALGQYIAGMGFSNCGLGIVHSMAHSLGAMYDTPHGIANAVLLPYVMAYNESASKEKYKDIALAMGVKGVHDMSLDEASASAITAVKDLSFKLGIPKKLIDLGINKEDIQELAGKSIKDVCTGGNPKEVTIKDIIEIYYNAFD